MSFFRGGQRGRPGAGRRPQRRRARAVDRRPGGLDDGARLPGRLRAQAERAVRLDPAVRALPRPVRRLRAGRSGCCTSTCSCCSASACRTSSSTAARSACRCRSCTRCCSTCSRACSSPASARARDAGPLVPHAPLTLLVVGLVFLTAVPDRAERGGLERDRRGLRGGDRAPTGSRTATSSTARASPPTSSAATPTGRSTTCSTCRSSRRCPGAGAGTTSPRPTARRSRFDLLVIGGLLLLGQAAAVRPGGQRRSAWRSPTPGWPTRTPRSRSRRTRTTRSWRSAAWRRCSRAHALRASTPPALSMGVALGLASAAKFVPLALAPLFARRRRADRVRARAPRCVHRRSRCARSCPDGGLRELYDRTVGYQASRPSPFSIWGQVDSLGWLQTVVKVAAAGLALLASPSCPGEIDLRQVAALGAARPDRAPARRDPLVLPLRRLVRAVRARGPVRCSRAGHSANPRPIVQPEREPVLA